IRVALTLHPFEEWTHTSLDLPPTPWVSIAGPDHRTPPPIRRTPPAGPTSGHHQCRPLGEGPLDPERECAAARECGACAESGTPQGTDLRSNRPGNDAHAHSQGRTALPLLRLGGPADARRSAMHRSPDTGRRD